MVEAPIFHVNGDDPEAVVHVAKIATEFRQKFQKPVVIDMVCYRRYGHNETDEPLFTQPTMYKAIKAHPTIVERYSTQLVEEGTISGEGVAQMKSKFREHLDEEYAASDGFKPNKADWLDGRWSGLGLADDEARRGNTGVEIETLKEIGRRITTLPTDLNAHKTVAKLLEKRREMVETGEGIDWGMAEHLAFGALVKEQFPVRLSGQDCERGTFSQRHSVVIDQDSERRYTPLKYVAPDQAKFDVINSMLSEEAVLGFEYGYSLSSPKALVLWEAQFGDFANGAQVLFDQFLSSGERKWLRMSGLVCLLPHGYEGQGPEHSSARLERFLQLSAEDNWQVANCTTPANYFHILRRQLHRRFRKPLILMTPKSLLRHKRVISRLDELGPDTTFHRVLWDDRASRGRTRRSSSSPTTRSAASCCRRARSTSISTRRARRPASTTCTCCASSSSIHSPRARSSPSWAAFPTPTWCGRRKSPRTWARGRSSNPISNGCSITPAARPSARAMPGVRHRHRRRRVWPPSMRPNRRHWSPRLCRPDARRDTRQPCRRLEPRHSIEGNTTDDHRDQGADAGRKRDRGHGRPVVQKAG